MHATRGDLSRLVSAFPFHAQPPSCLSFLLVKDICDASNDIVHICKPRLANHFYTINIDPSSTNSSITNNFNSCSITSLGDIYAQITIGTHAVITTLAYKC